jgi:hypothetical protein
MEHSGFAMFKARLGEVCREVERKGGIGLGVRERMLLIMLPLMCNDIGCTRFDLRAIRSRIFPEAGVWLSTLGWALRRLEKRRLVTIFKAYGGGRYIYLDYMKRLQSETIETIPAEPMPPWIECVKTGKGSYKVIQYDK